MDAKESPYKEIQELWSKMTPDERVLFIMELAKTVGRKPTWWDGKSASELSLIEDVDNLPGSFTGRLIYAYTEDGFSIEEMERCLNL